MKVSIKRILATVAIMFGCIVNLVASSKPAAQSLVRQRQITAAEQKDKNWAVLSVAIAHGDLQTVKNIVPHLILPKEENDTDFTPVEIAQNAKHNMDAALIIWNPIWRLLLREICLGSLHDKVVEHLQDFANNIREGNIGVLEEVIKSAKTLIRKWGNMQAKNEQGQSLRDRLTSIRKEIGEVPPKFEAKIKTLDNLMATPLSIRLGTKRISNGCKNVFIPDSLSALSV